ncbi:NDP-sugar synthase [Candidatus Woesearchaeota archaeon]|nr:NDP-sugar synthase [Candidatus Woesearchaeota archaeon]
MSDIDSIIDNIYVRNRSQAIELLVNNALGENRVAVILFGGEETSLKISENQYRITGKIDSSTVFELAIKKLKEDGFKTIYAISRHNIITELFKLVQNGSKYGVNIQYIEEKESLGTADSLRLLRGKVKTNFLVVYGDTIFTEVNMDELWNEHIKRKGMTTLLLTTTPTPSKKGVVKIEGTKILDFVQKPKDSDVYLGFSSIFVTQPELLEYQGNSLEEQVFPILAQKGLLNGYLSTSKVVKIHSLPDLKKAEHLVK